MQERVGVHERAGVNEGRLKGDPRALTGADDERSRELVRRVALVFRVGGVTAIKRHQEFIRRAGSPLEGVERES